MKIACLYKWLLIAAFCMYNHSFAQSAPKIIPAADRTEVYIPLLKGKRIGVFANHTSVIGNTHLVDSLLKRGLKITKAFGPEHGFRGTADAGEHIPPRVAVSCHRS